MIDWMYEKKSTWCAEGAKEKNAIAIQTNEIVFGSIKTKDRRTVSWMLVSSYITMFAVKSFQNQTSVKWSEFKKKKKLSYWSCKRLFVHICKQAVLTHMVIIPYLQPSNDK